MLVMQQVMAVGSPEGASHGVHGDAEGLAGVIGGILYVFINGLVYSAVVALVLRLKRRRNRPADQSRSR